MQQFFPQQQYGGCSPQAQQCASCPLKYNFFPGAFQQQPQFNGYYPQQQQQFNGYYPQQQQQFSGYYPQQQYYYPQQQQQQQQCYYPQQQQQYYYPQQQWQNPSASFVG